MTYIKTFNLQEANPAGRVRTANQRSQIAYLQSRGKDPRFDEVISGVGASSTYEGNGIGGVNMVVTNNGEYVIREGKEKNYYYPGSPSKIEMTASNFHLQSGVVKRFGYFSSSIVAPYATVYDGFVLESDDNYHYVKIYRQGTEVYSRRSDAWLNQSKVANWNPQGFGFYVIEFIYLGGAIAVFKILIDGELVPVAEYTHEGVDVSTFVKSPNQPIRYEIRSTGGAGEFNHICGDVASEGTGDQIVDSKSTHIGSEPITSLSQDQRYALVGIRLKQADRLQVVDIYNFSILAANADDILIELVIGGTVAGPVWTDKANSFMQVFNGYTIQEATSIASLQHSGGDVLFSTYMAGNKDKDGLLQNSRRTGSLINGVSEELFVCITPVTNGAQALAAINWNEFI